MDDYSSNCLNKLSFVDKIEKNERETSYRGFFACSASTISKFSIFKYMATDIYHSALTYFIAHQGELCQKYNGKELLMTADSVVGAYDSAEEAFLEGKKRFGSGNFALQTCLPGEEAYSVSISPFLVEF